MLVAVTLAGSSACNRGAAPAGTSTPAAATTDKPAPAKPVPQQLPDVLARVNSEEIKKAEFDRLVRNVEVSNQQTIPPDRRDEILRALLDQLIEYTVLKQETAARKIDVSDQEVDQEVERMKAQRGSEAAFAKSLAEREMSLDRLRSDTRADLAIKKMLSAQTESATPATDADARAFYEKNPDKFKSPESVRASHILIRVADTAPDDEKKKARARIDAVLKRARAGEDFAVLAREHSQDGSAAQGGDLNYFGRGRMVPPFDQAAFSLKPNEISDVVTTEFGYHIIKVVDRKPAVTVPFEEVSENVKRFLSQQRKQETAQSFINQVKQKSKIEVLI